MGTHEGVIRDRLAVVRRTLGLAGADDSDAELGTLDMVCSLIDHLRQSRDPASAWLLIVGLTAAYPSSDLVRATLRQAELVSAEEAAVWLLRASTDLAMAHGRADARLVVVDDRPLVDVDFTAKSDFLTGIQRVVRSTVQQWSAGHELELVVWNSLRGGFRFLREDERDRLLQEEVGEFTGHVESDAAEDAQIVVPWKVPVILLEVPEEGPATRLATIGEDKIASVRLVGYDCIPVSSGELVNIPAAGRFGIYLEMLKHADRVAGISHTATAEFAGFVSALSAQGLTGPVVTACPLPNVTQVSQAARPATPPERPIVACVGSVTRRKNQSALVVAAELLWREGLDFEVRLLGHVSGESMPIHTLVPELRKKGRPLEIESGVSDARIAEVLAESRCLVFPSLHEGFGLPIVEALSAGVPVITSDFGSTREVAEGQGGLLIDPDDLQALTDAMRLLLTDDAEHARLVAEAANRPVRTWNDYANDLWEALS